ncbi:serglycin [Erpetoichthys calabaricus]|uniref:serglycin n=1 Tax=Erpetoichthys calabaricus TaxID=27687 RepID=UPI0010A057C2|nr:serglycin [Erpetoichthys calabaricus]
MGNSKGGRFRSAVLALSFLFLVFLEHAAQGAPAKGRFMWVRCKPDSKDANCIEQKGPWIDLPKSGVNRILPPNADPEQMMRMVNNFNEEDLSGDFSGDVQIEGKPEPDSKSKVDVARLTKKEEEVEEEEGSALDSTSPPDEAEVDYSLYSYPVRVPANQQGITQDLKLQEEGFIL